MSTLAKLGDALEDDLFSGESSLTDEQIQAVVQNDGVEMNAAIAEIQAHQEDAKRMLVMADGVESYRALLRDAKKKGGINKDVATAIHIGLEHMVCDLLNIYSDMEKPLPAVEEFRMEKRELSTTASIESLNELSRKLWAAIQAVLRALVTAFKQSTMVFKNQASAQNALAINLLSRLNKARAMTGESFDVNGASALFVDGQFCGGRALGIAPTVHFFARIYPGRVAAYAGQFVTVFNDYNASPAQLTEAYANIEQLATPEVIEGTAFSKGRVLQNLPGGRKAIVFHSKGRSHAELKPNAKAMDIMGQTGLAVIHSGGIGLAESVSYTPVRSNLMEAVQEIYQVTKRLKEGVDVPDFERIFQGAGYEHEETSMREQILLYVAGNVGRLYPQDVFNYLSGVISKQLGLCQEATLRLEKAS